MDGVPILAMVVGLLALVAAAFVPLLLPWPQRVRWVVAAQAMSEGGWALAGFPRPDVREVLVVSVDVRGEVLEIGVLEVGRRPGVTLTFMSAAPRVIEASSMLLEWSALRTPMLLCIDPRGVASLEGPAATVTDLRSVRARTAEAA